MSANYTDVIIYHNPECGTSRSTLAMIRNSGIEPHVIEYLKTPPSRTLLQQLVERMGVSVRDILREKGLRRVFPLAVPMLMPNTSSGNVSLLLGARAGAHTTVSACASGAESMGTAYDMIRDGRGEPVVLELELTEPSMFFLHAPDSANRFADALLES